MRDATPRRATGPSSPLDAVCPSIIQSCTCHSGFAERLHQRHTSFNASGCNTAALYRKPQDFQQGVTLAQPTGGANSTLAGWDWSHASTGALHQRISCFLRPIRGAAVGVSSAPCGVLLLMQQLPSVPFCLYVYFKKIGLMTFEEMRSSVNQSETRKTASVVRKVRVSVSLA